MAHRSSAGRERYRPAAAGSDGGGGAGGSSAGFAPPSNKREHPGGRSSSNTAQKRTKVRGGSGAAAAAASKHGTKYCDEDGHYLWVKNERLEDRYRVDKQLGEGTFGTVVQCHDLKKDRRVAIKMVRNVPKYRDAAMIEIKILKDLRKHFDETAPFVVLWDCFDFRNHVCMVFEPLGTSIYDFVSTNEYQPFPPQMVREMAQQLTDGVRMLHETRKLCHTDLKPENILLVSNDYDVRKRVSSSGSGRLKDWKVPKSSRIKLIDFGSATYDDQHHTSIVCTRHYRPPEVVLGLGWSYPCDIWSIGCILMEMYTGEALFQTHDNLEHLALMEVTLDRKLPVPMVQRAKTDRRGRPRHAAKYFEERRDVLRWPAGAKSDTSIDYVRRTDPISDLIPRKHDSFYDMIKEMLRADPDRRCTAAEALSMPYFTDRD